MTNNCLVKTVKGNANIEHPQYLGELRYPLKDMDAATNVLLVSHEPGAKFKVLGGHFEDNQGTNIGDTITTSSSYSDGGYGGFFKVMKDSAGAVIVFPKYETMILRAQDTVFVAGSVNLDNDLENSSITDIYGYANSTIGNLKKLPINLKVIAINPATNVTGKLSDLINYINLEYIDVNQNYIDIDVPLKGLYSLDKLDSIRCYAFGSVEDFVALQIAKKSRTSCETFDIRWPSHQLTFDGEDAASGSEHNYLSWAAGSTTGQYNVTYNSTTITIAVNSDGTWSKVS